MAHTDPTNHWIVVVGEAETHPGSRRPISQDMIFELQNGYWSNMYVTTVDGQHWYQLTHFSANQGAFGVIAPHFSRDGKQITWGQASRAPTRAQIYGQWQLKVADFVVDASGVPSLQNIRTYTGPGGHFYEPESWSADDGKVLLSADIGMPSVYGLDIFTLDIATGQFTNLTNSPEQWDEHAHYSPAGNKILYMSSSPVPNLVRILPPNVTYGQVVGQYLKTELWMMNPDGSGKQELTYFSTPGHPEYQGGAKVNVDESMWNADGSQVFVGARGAGPGPWLLTFAGRCGGS
jgi:Tol biopolymer transport system component